MWLIHILTRVFHKSSSSRISLVTLRCTPSSVLVSFLWYGLHACMQYFKCGLSIALYNGMISFFSIYVMFLLIRRDVWLPFKAAIPPSTSILSFVGQQWLYPTDHSFP